MSNNHDIPILTDLIEKGIEIKLSDLGLDQDIGVDDDKTEPDLESDPFASASNEEPEFKPIDANLHQHPEVTAEADIELQARAILDHHVEQAWVEIRQLLRNYRS